MSGLGALSDERPTSSIVDGTVAGPTCHRRRVIGPSKRPRRSTGAHGARRRRVHRVARAWSTSTRICASPAARTRRPSRSAHRAAALGGYTAVVAMPNTEPPLDCVAVVDSVLERGRRGRVPGRTSRRPSRWAARGEAAGAHGRAGRPRRARCSPTTATACQDDRVMRRAFEYARRVLAGLDRLAQHCEDDSLAAAGHMHEGAWSAGWASRASRPRPRSSMVARDLALARLTGGRYPLPAPVRRPDRSSWCARPRPTGLARDGRGHAQHFTLTEAELRRLRPGVQGEPAAAHPGRRGRLRAGLADGTIDAIATDHAPHTPEPRSARSRRRRPACSAWRRPSRWP